tara:strand:- start:336 stop:674 length:339 start_codon:yes stop_codon:yes gene_type:complete
MISKAVNKYIRRTPRKVNTVLDIIRGKNVDYAFMLLKAITKGAKEEVSKTLKSAVSNAYEKGYTDTAKISISEAYSTEGPIFKRFKARAMGRATRRYKRTSHITIILKEESN